MKKKHELIFLHIIRGIYWLSIISIIFSFLVDIMIMIRVPDYPAGLSPMEFGWKMSTLLFFYWISTLITKEIKKVKVD